MWTQADDLNERVEGLVGVSDGLLFKVDRKQNENVRERDFKRDEMLNNAAHRITTVVHSSAVHAYSLVIIETFFWHEGFGDMSTTLEKWRRGLMDRCLAANELDYVPIFIAATSAGSYNSPTLIRTNYDPFVIISWSDHFPFPVWSITTKISFKIDARSRLSW